MQRTAGQGNVNGMFVQENANTGQPPTEITADWMNAVQEELCGVIEGSGIALDVTDNKQLVKAINLLLAANKPKTEAEKWDLYFPVGHKEPFIPEIMGDLQEWLVAHPKWAVLNNDVVADIEGRVLGVASAGLPAGTRIGSPNSTLPWHGHAVNDPSHSHSVGNQLLYGGLAMQGGNTYSLINGGTDYAITGISVAGAGSEPTNTNYQPTLFVTWVYKKL